MKGIHVDIYWTSADLWQLLLVEEQLIKEQQHHGVCRPTVVNTGLDANFSGLADQRG